MGRFLGGGAIASTKGGKIYMKKYYEKRRPAVTGSSRPSKTRRLRQLLLPPLLQPTSSTAEDFLNISRGEGQGPENQPKGVQGEWGVE